MTKWLAEVADDEKTPKHGEVVEIEARTEIAAREQIIADPELGNHVNKITKIVTRRSKEKL
jgi:hypothetical protein